MDYGDILNSEMKEKVSYNEWPLNTQVLYCTKCYWRIEGVGMKPICPKCGDHLFMGRRTGRETKNELPKV